jgi:hypothetical protein
MIRKETFTDYDETPVYYVYNIVNPSTRIPFYVGKGKGGRCYQHLLDKPEYSKNKRLTGHIQNLRKIGIEPEVIKIKENLKEKEAYLMEEEQILNYGRIGFDEDGFSLISLFQIAQLKDLRKKMDFMVKNIQRKQKG